MNKTILKDPADLAIHPSAKLMPEWTKDDPRFGALVEDVRERGIDKPIKCDKEFRIVDGRTIWRVAKQLQLAEVECQVVPDDQIIATILGSLLHRKHFTRAQLAYLSFPIIESGYEESKLRRLKNLRNRQCSPETALNAASAKTSHDFARQIGVCERSLRQASELHKHFKNPAKFEWIDEADPLTLKEYYEPRILHPDKPHGLGAVLAGIGSKLSPDSISQQKNGQLELFTGAFDTVFTRFEYWKGMDATLRRHVLDKIREEIDDMAPERCAEMSELFSKLANLLNQRAKEEAVA